MRILLLGLDSAGKTTILQQLKLGVNSPTVPTIGFNVETILFHNFEFNIWDVGGQDRLRPFWRHYYGGTSGIIFTVDAADIPRLELAKSELLSLLREEELQFAVLCILANKQDLPNAIKKEEIIKIFELDAIQSRKFHVEETIATTGKGLTEALDWLALNMEPI